MVLTKSERIEAGKKIHEGEMPGVQAALNIRRAHQGAHEEGLEGLSGPLLLAGSSRGRRAIFLKKVLHPL